MMNKLNIAVVGASGLSGGELCRLLLNHSQVGRIHPVSRSNEISFETIHPNLLGSGLHFCTMEDVRKDLDQIDVAFCCTPTGEAMQLVPEFMEHDVRVIDLSADFRFQDQTKFQDVYGKLHQAVPYLEQAVYGITELSRKKIEDARLIANPGCYVITVLLALAPLMKSDFANFALPIHISAINGTSGAGATPRRELNHAMSANNMLPYNMEGHRHAPEMEMQLSQLADKDINVIFSTSHGPFPRGIHALISVKVSDLHAEELDRQSLITLYKDYYGDNGKGDPFVIILDSMKKVGKNEKEYSFYPNVARVMGSNFCHIGMDYDRYSNSIKIISVTDNLVKGAAGSALQNMNVMFGLDEREGLRHFGL